MARADFNMVRFNHEFTSGSSNFESREFHIEGTPIDDDAYLLIQVRGIAAQHSIIISQQGNQQVVLEPGGLLPAPGNTQALRVGMNHIRPGVLRTGLNTITIQRFGNDTFFVDWVVVHWREP